MIPIKTGQDIILRPTRGLIITELINLVSLVQSHHKTVGMYGYGVVTLSLGQVTFISSFKAVYRHRSEKRWANFGTLNDV